MKMAKDFENAQVVDSYDVHIRKLIPGYDAVHQQILALLQARLAPEAKILIIGAGTGYELCYLMRAFPHARFTASEYSAAMLDKARAAVAALNEQDRVQFIHGDYTTQTQLQQFDAVLSILVTHFVPFEQKADFFKNVCLRLKADGIFLTYDLLKMSHPHEEKALALLCQANGLSAKQAQAMLQRLPDDFFAISALETEQLLKQAGFLYVDSFAQNLCYRGYSAIA